MTQVIYLDTSAALKLVFQEAESQFLAHWLNATANSGASICSSFLLYVEMHCAARRRTNSVPSSIEQLLSGISLITLSDTQLIDAAANSYGLRSADAIHLSVARYIDSDALVTYDKEMIQAATKSGITVVSPGA
ncbi:MAG: type II toxin-antitoxin system VapC family toxin [Actinomycetaceae bacterium]|nr:type II toxin-antitoxin system VapC family toxin [Actinomycetaceae bacterium]